MASQKLYPRGVAVRALTRVLSDFQPLDETLLALYGEIDPQAKPWLQEVASGTLRWRGRLDLAIDSGALKKKPTGWLRKMLLVAAYQLIVQERTHPGAVVSETVDEIKRKEGKAPGQFANAVLRKISEHARSWRELPFPKAAPLKEKAAWASLPEWLWSKLVQERGEDWAVSYAQASLERPRTWLLAQDEEFIPKGAEKGPLARSWYLTEGGMIAGREGFGEGRFIVQDISSQLLVEEISKSVKARLGEGTRPKALDLCAAPGGKSVGLAWNGFQVSATDRDEARISLLRQTVERAAPGIQIVKREEVQSQGPYDLVWVDAPCTGTGILRRHPDVRWLKSPKDMDPLNRLQHELLTEAWRLVRPGGFLAYSVCSVLPDEGKGMIERAALASNLVNEWLLLPQEGPQGDGFWAALMGKPADSRP